MFGGDDIDKREEAGGEERRGEERRRLERWFDQLLFFSLENASCKFSTAAKKHLGIPFLRWLKSLFIFRSAAYQDFT